MYNLTFNQNKLSAIFFRILLLNDQSYHHDGLSKNQFFHVYDVDTFLHVHFGVI